MFCTGLHGDMHLSQQTRSLTLNQREGIPRAQYEKSFVNSSFVMSVSGLISHVYCGHGVGEKQIYHVSILENHPSGFEKSNCLLNSTLGKSHSLCLTLCNITAKQRSQGAPWPAPLLPATPFWFFFVINFNNHQMSFSASANILWLYQMASLCYGHHF